MELTLLSQQSEPNQSNHLVKSLNLPKMLTQIEKNMHYTQKAGQDVYRNFPLFRDIATVMEHPEFYTFYQKYLVDSQRRKQVLILLQLYEHINQLLEQNKTVNLSNTHPVSNLNAYHKLFILYSLLNQPEFSRKLLEHFRKTSEIPQIL